MFLPLFIVLALLALWSIYWFVAIGIVKTMAGSAREELAHQGLSLDCTQESWGGYPFRFEFNCSSPILSLKHRSDAKSGNLHAVALAYNPWQVVLLLDGPTTIDGVFPLPMKATHDRIIASITMGKDSRLSVSADIPKLVLPELLSADRIMIHTRPGTSTATDVAASFDTLNYQPAGRPEFPVRTGTLLGSLTPDLALSVESIELQENNVRYWGKGTVSLDRAHRLAGKLATETNDLEGLLAILEPHLEMSDQQKAGLRSMLGLLGNEAKADIIAKDGQLFIGPFKVADLIALY